MKSIGGVLFMPPAQTTVTMQFVYGEMDVANIGCDPPRLAKLELISVRCPVKVKSMLARRLR